MLWACGQPTSDAQGSPTNTASSGGTSPGPDGATEAGPNATGSTGGTGGSNSAGTTGMATSGNVTATSATGGASASSGSGSTGGAAGSPTAERPIDCRVDGDGTTTVSFVNRCARALTFEGSDIDSGVLAPGGFACRDVGDDSTSIPSKRYWAFAGENPGAEHHTLAEFTFNTDFNDFDWYNISHVDAHNLPMQVVPVARPDCSTLTCAEDFLAGCPEEGRYTDSGGAVVACVSPERDNPDSPVARYFERCDEAYAWSGDDQLGNDPSPVAACAGEDWDIVFCPEAE